jgi:hypothetical protein
MPLSVKFYRYSHQSTDAFAQNKHTTSIAPAKSKGKEKAVASNSAIHIAKHKTNPTEVEAKAKATLLKAKKDAATTKRATRRPKRDDEMSAIP